MSFCVRTLLPPPTRAFLPFNSLAIPLARFLRWEVGQAREFGIDSIEEGVRMVTGNLASMYNLPPGVGDITQGGPANFVGFNGDPFSTLSNIEFVAVAGKFECRPQQK